MSSSLHLSRHQLACFATALYAIIDTQAIGTQRCSEVAREVLRAGGRILQLRAKDLASGALLEIARALRRLTAAAGALLIVNDRVDIAALVGADGVHLGAEDLPLPAARALLGPDVLVGRSTHGLTEARVALAAGADYIGYGPIFETTTKAVAAPPRGLERLRALRPHVDVPIVAIGGIDEATAADVRAAGADAVAVIGEIARASDVARKVAGLLRAVRAGGRGTP
jgi:thiamine-phosphate pyrophosphorylase